jgi:hypothetical protein
VAVVVVAVTVTVAPTIPSVARPARQVESGMMDDMRGQKG